jgi:uncharacterized protein (DUF1684 family)
MPKAECRMPKRAAFGILVSAFGILNSAFSLACRPAEAPYEHEIVQARAEKDRAFKIGRESPLKPPDRERFTALAYFPPDESYRAAAALRVAPKDEQPVVTMPTSTGKQRDYRQIGSLEFNLKGEPLTLVAFVEVAASGVNSNRLFVPFRDLTNGAETYPAGRYLELDPTPTGLYDLDFNKAYNPYCAYNEEYDCPYPPASNRLKIPIRAGEKSFEMQSKVGTPSP